MVDWMTIINNLIPFVFGGGLVGLFTIPQKKRAEKLANEATVSSQWRELAERIEKRSEKQDEKIGGLYAEMRGLRERNNALETENVKLKIFKCEKLSCTDRLPPFGSLVNKESKEVKDGEC